MSGRPKAETGRVRPLLHDLFMANFFNFSRAMEKRQDRVVRNLERAAERRDKKNLDGWLNAWAKNDKKELRRFEREMDKD